MAECIVPGCPEEARNNLGVRLRRADTSAIWAPNSEAYVCDAHARSGARIELFYEATETGEVEVRVRGSAGDAARTTPIRNREEATPAEALAARVDELVEEIFNPT